MKSNIPIRLQTLYTSAGASRRSNISDTYKNFLVFASRFNIYIADSQRIVHHISIGSFEITYIKTEDDYIFVGDSDSKLHIYKISCIEDLVSVHIYTNKLFDDSIVTFNKLGKLENKIYMATTMSRVCILCDKQILVEIEHDELISYGIAINLGANIYCVVIGFDNGNLKCYRYVENDIKLDFHSMISAHQSNIKCIKHIKIDNESYFATSSLDCKIKVFKVLVNDDGYEYRIDEVCTLYGHKDWVFGCNWIDNGDIISCSADNTILYWKLNRNNGILSWKIEVRMGGVTEKNQTFYNAMSVNNGSVIIGQSISGGFYKYVKEKSKNIYILQNYISGHVDEITSIDVKDDLILSSSLDFTTRLFSIKMKEEIGRPQIHGYPINSSKFIKNNRFEIVSGAQETIMRVLEATQIFLKNYKTRMDDHERKLKNKEIAKGDNPEDDVEFKCNKPNYYGRNLKSEERTMNDNAENGPEVDCDKPTNLKIKGNHEIDNAKNGHKVDCDKPTHLKIKGNHEIDNEININQNVVDVKLEINNKNLINKERKYPLMARLSELSLTNEIDENNYEEILAEGNNERNLSRNFVFSEKQKVYGHFFEIQDIDISNEFIISCNKSALKKYSGIFIWKLNGHTIEKCGYIKVHELGIQKLKFSYDHTYFIACSRDKKTSLYKKKETYDQDETPFELMNIFENHKRIVWDCGISFDNKYCASCSRDKNIIVYGIENYDVLAKVTFECEVTALCFSPIDHIIVLGLENGDVCFCRLEEKGNKLAIIERYNAHAGIVKCINFKECGKVFVTGGYDGAVKVFQILENSVNNH